MRFFFDQKLSFNEHISQMTISAYDFVLHIGKTILTLLA
ncbi:unnamed protein product [Callosobruchus maculatus]|uniref:Uncharacterized protein n=1 Tax=Callosobruchus maculatus TaxID=64391 RepID=A0A653C2S4_CALMS|nr:unnamed protein product [Callosobruchus maculatus]